jgi:hypothetical protein
MTDAAQVMPHHQANEETADADSPAIDRWRYATYIFIVLLFPFVFLLSAIPIVRSSSFLRVSGDPFLLNADYAYSLRQQNCQIVLFGDSTAVTGLDPLLVEQLTGLKTCNIAQSQSILEIVGTSALDTYLKNNTAPKYIVIELAPETFTREHLDFFWAEGLTILVRRKSLPEALSVLMLHPVEAYNFSMWAIKAKLSSMAGPGPDFAAMQSIFESRHGLLTLPKPPETQCYRSKGVPPPSAKWVKQLRDRYTVNGTRVLIDVSPVPTCAPEADRIQASMSSITDNSLPLYPISLFCDLDRHLTYEGAERSSTEIAHQIASLNHDRP